MSEQTFLCHSKNLREVFQDRYTIGSYQREYRWQKKQIADLVSDFYTAFNGPGKRVGNATYFLGTTATQGKKGATRIIDGQQRLTTITLICIYLSGKTKDDVSKKILAELIYSFKGGNQTLSVDIPDRNWLIYELIDISNDDAEPSWDAVGKRVEKEQSISNRNILNAFKYVSEEFEELNISETKLKKFISWLSYKVYLVVIQASSNDSAGVIFEVMNDRGVGLTASELLKAHLVSHINSEPEIGKVDKSWRETTGLLHYTKSDTNDEKFFRAWFRAKYADNQPDFNEIGGKYHHWARSKDPWGTSTEGNIANFVKKEMRKFADYYHFMQLASWPSNQGDHTYDGFEAIYFNKTTSFDLQYTCALAPIRTNDSLEIARTKLRLVTSALEIFVVRRMVNNESYSAANVKGIIFELIRDIRNCSIATLQKKLLAWLASQEEEGSLLSNIEYATPRVKQSRYLLARITAWFDDQMDENKTSFYEYMSGSNTLEHILPDTYNPRLKEFEAYSDQHDYTTYRQRISALLILDKNDNSSVGAKPYDEKLKAYSDANWLAKSLVNDRYPSNPRLKALQKRYGKDLGPYEMFNKIHIDYRGKVIAKFAKQIWNPEKALKI